MVLFGISSEGKEVNFFVKISVDNYSHAVS
jgi:hypothetical protein